MTSKSPSTPLTDLQLRALRAIARLTKEAGYPPTLFEVSGAMGLYERSAKVHVAALIRKGYLAKTPNTARSLRVLKMPAKAKETP